MTFFQSIILGIVEGITEFLPISSTGHLIVTANLLGIPDSEFLKSFQIFIQLGAILAVVYLYRSKLFVFTEQNVNIWKKVTAAFIPTAIIGFILYSFIKEYLLDNIVVVVISLILGGIILIAFELWQQKKGEDAKYQSIEDTPYKVAVYIGLAQVLAMIPGVSRSGTTIVAGRMLSLSKKAIIDFSFLLAIPVMFGATSLDMLKAGWGFSTEQFILLFVGFVVSFFVALIVIKWLLSYITKHSFIVFGMYRILAGLVFFYLFF